MVELSLHVLDIAQNSIKAGASLVEIEINENTIANTLVITITDNGCGMAPDFLKDVTNPFRTTRTTRKVGLGLSMFKSAAELTGGSFSIWSEQGKGTKVKAEFVHNSIDRQPIGDMAATLTTVINANPSIDYVYKHSYNGNEFDFDTRQMREALGAEVNLSENDVLLWIDDYIKNETENIYGGAI